MQTRIEGQTDAAQTRGNAGGKLGMDVIIPLPLVQHLHALISCDMPVQSFKTNQKDCAVLKQIRSLMLMFCSHILLL